jgi:hypothetical protein
VERNQKFEKLYSEWCNCGYNSKDTYTNAVAPVAMPSFALDARKQGVIDDVHSVSDTVQYLRDQFNRAADLAGETKLPTLRSGPLTDFMTAMHKSIDMAMSINGQIAQRNYTAMDNLEAKLNAFYDSQLDAQGFAEGALKTISDSVTQGNVKPTPAIPAPPPPKAAGGFHLNLTWLDNSEVIDIDGDRAHIVIRCGSGRPCFGNGQIAEVTFTPNEFMHCRLHADWGDLSEWEILLKTRIVDRRKLSNGVVPNNGFTDKLEGINFFIRPADYEALQSAVKKTFRTDSGC